MEIHDTLVPGLSLRVTAKGERSWALRYVAASGHRRRFGLGAVDVRSLGAARKEARALLARVCLGADPQQELRATRRAKRSRARTVGWICDQMLEAATLRPRTRTSWRRTLAAEILPAWGSVPADELTRSDVRRWMQERARRSVAMAKLTLTVLRRAYSWAVDVELVPASPCVGIRGLGSRPSSDRVLSRVELRALLAALDAMPCGMSDLVRWLLLTGVRRAAGIGARFDEITDLDGPEPRWLVPGGPEGRSKSGRPHLVPLSPQAVRLALARRALVPCEFIFPSQSRRKAVGWSSEFVGQLQVKVDELLGAKAPKWNPTPLSVCGHEVHLSSRR